MKGKRVKDAASVSLDIELIYWWCCLAHIVFNAVSVEDYSITLFSAQNVYTYRYTSSLNKCEINFYPNLIDPYDPNRRSTDVHGSLLRRKMLNWPNAG